MSGRARTIEPFLTSKQEAFCLAYLEAANASDAYRTAYDAARMAPATINRKAKALLDDGKIAARIQALRAPAVQKAQVTLESHLAMLATLRDAALSAEKFGPAVQAEVARGRASGFYVERQEHGGPHGGPIPFLGLSDGNLTEPMRIALYQRLQRQLQQVSDADLAEIALAGEDKRRQ